VSTQPPIHGVPTLTEVIEITGLSAGALNRPLLHPPLDGEASLPAPSSPAAALLTSPSSLPLQPPLQAHEGVVIERMLDDVLSQVEVMFEHRMREAMMPALMAAADSMVLQLRAELAPVLRELVSRAVTREMARLGGD
jgi:hypothetical protein